jgi:hypothetical protein
MIGRRNQLDHSIEQWIERINAMKDLCIQAHRLRNEFAEISYKEYDYDTCKHLLEQVQSMAAGIANENITDIKTDMDSWKKDGS